MVMPFLDAVSASKMNMTATARIGLIEMELIRAKKRAHFTVTAQFLPQAIWSEIFRPGCLAFEHTLRGGETVSMLADCFE